MSRDPGHDELGVQRQRLECEELCRRKGWKIGTVHVDDDRSAYRARKRRKPRLGYLDALRRLEMGAIRGLVSWHPDRLHRDPTELEAFIDLIEDCGASVVTARAGEYDLSTPAGRLQARIFGAIARHESEHKSERILSKMQQLREAGMHTGGGKRPYGYETREAGLQEQGLRPDEAEVVREMVKRALAGESMLSLCRDLNERGILSATGGRWSLSSMSRLLRSARIGGLREYRGRLIAAPWPAIITEREHQELRALLSANARAGTRSQRSYLLTGGIVRCGNCTAEMIGRPLGSQHRPTYACVKERGGCNRVFARADDVDRLTAEATFREMEAPGFAERVQRLANPAQSNEIIDAITRQEERVREIEDDYAAGELDRQEYRWLRDGARAKLDDLRSQVKPSKVMALLDYQGASLRAAWPALSLGKRRTILEALDVTVTILPRGKRNGPRFDKGRVSVKIP